MIRAWRCILVFLLFVDISMHSELKDKGVSDLGEHVHYFRETNRFVLFLLSCFLILRFLKLVSVSSSIKTLVVR